MVPLLHYFTLCWFSWCLRRSTLRWKPLEQMSHPKGLKPVCLRLWVIRLELWLNAFPHTWHLWGFSPAKIKCTDSKTHIWLLYSYMFPSKHEDDEEICRQKKATLRQVAPYQCEYMCASSCPISGGTSCHRIGRGRAWCPSEWGGVWTKLRTAWMTCHTFCTQSSFPKTGKPI